MKFKIKFLKQYAYSRNPFLVYRIDVEGRHSHVSSKEIAMVLINSLTNGYMPSSDYLKRSARKLLTDKEFEKLRPYKKKQNYYNRKHLNKNKERRLLWQ